MSKKTSVYLVTLYGQGDIYHHLLTKEQWDSWPAAEDPCEYMCTLDPKDNGALKRFWGVRSLVKHLEKHNLKIAREIHGPVY